MHLQKLNPWNWFKHEESCKEDDHQIPVTRAEASVVAVPACYPNSLLRLHREMDQLFEGVFNGLVCRPYNPSWDLLPRLSAAYWK